MPFYVVYCCYWRRAVRRQHIASKQQAGGRQFLLRFLNTPALPDCPLFPARRLGGYAGLFAATSEEAHAGVVLKGWNEDRYGTQLFALVYTNANVETSPRAQP